mgnify:CR=1 FL=1
MVCFFFQAEDGIGYLVRSRGLGDVYKRQVKVTPPHGRPYYLVDDKGSGVFSRRDDLDSGLRVPLWVIKEF